MTAILARSIRDGRVVLTPDGEWRRIRRARQYGPVVTLEWHGGYAELACDQAVTVLPKLTDPQAKLLARVAAGHIVEGTQSKPYDETLTHLPTSKVPAATLRRLTDAGLIRAVRGRPGDTARTHVYGLTDTGRAVLAQEG